MRLPRGFRVMLDAHLLRNDVVENRSLILLSRCSLRRRQNSLITMLGRPRIVAARLAPAVACGCNNRMPSQLCLARLFVADVRLRTNHYYVAR
jgi:hypothetical protein